MAGTIYFNPNMAQDADGNPVSGAQAYFYDTGTTTPQTVYSDSGLTTAHPVPLVADASGNFADVYTSGSTGIKVNVTGPDGIVLPGYPVDPAILQEAGSFASAVSFSGTATLSSTNVQDAIEEVDGKAEDLKAVNAASATIYATGGTPTDYTISVPGVNSYTLNDRYAIRINATNSGPATLNVESTGGINIYKYDATGAVGPLVAGDLAIGSEYLVHYDGTQFVIISERLSRADTSVWESGTEVTLYASSPANIKSAIDALSPISAQFYESAGQTITSAGALTLVHGLASKPKIINYYLRCLTAEAGYSVGDELHDILGVRDTSTTQSRGMAVVADATNINIRFSSTVSVFANMGFTTGASTPLTNANWELYVQAWS